jgi:hypothetical protein
LRIAWSGREAGRSEMKEEKQETENRDTNWQENMEREGMRETNTEKKRMLTGRKSYEELILQINTKIMKTYFRVWKGIYGEKSQNK